MRFRKRGYNVVLPVKKPFLGRESVGIGMIFLAAFLSLFGFLILKNQARCLSRTLKDLENAKMVYERKLADARLKWNERISLKDLDNTITRAGLEMRLVRPEQVIHMQADGRPAPGQISVARAQARKASYERVAGISPVLPPAGAPARRRGGTTRRR